jgi:hypothetical protein
MFSFKISKLLSNHRIPDQKKGGGNMPKYRYKNFGITFGLIFTLLIFFGPLAKAQNSDNFLRKKNLHPKMENLLSELEEEHGKGAGYAKQFAKKRNIKIDDLDRVTVFIYLDKDKPINIKSLQAHGAEIIKGTDDVIKVSVPVGMLRAIADNVEGVSFIKLPDKPISQTTSQGVGLTGASSYHSAGNMGSGAKVAIIDLGFKGLTSAILNGELPGGIYVLDCTGSGCVNKTPPWDLIWEGEEHGTAVAEIVYDMAPDAQLYLMKVDDPSDLVDAKNFCIANGIKIINHSIGWFNTNFYDGQCYNSNPVCTANDAYANGILWVNSAGNHALEHYEAIFTDSNVDYWHDQLLSFSASSGQLIQIVLTWNAWPATNQDYNLYLFDSLWNLVAYSENPQIGTQPPTEKISIYAPYTSTYYIMVLNWNATSNHWFKIFTPEIRLTPYVTSRSLASPADASGVLAVAAINYNNWTTGPQESFSSQGPTTDGRTKPDISGPDGVSNYTIPVFEGTSAAAPHVAGAAALILSANPGYSVSQLWNTLTNAAIDIGSPGKDNIYGYGRLNLPPTSCSYTISPTGRSHGSGAETGSVSVTVGSNCSWTASTNSGSWDWIGISSGWSGIGNGTVNYFVLANNTGNTRTGTLTIAGQTFTITQTAGGCSYPISPPSNSFSGAAGTGSVSVTAGAGCSWAAFLDPGSWGWLGISAGASNWGGTGSGTVNYYYFANNTGQSRTGKLHIAGQDFQVTQEGQ